MTTHQLIAAHHQTVARFQAELERRARNGDTLAEQFLRQEFRLHPSPELRGLRHRANMGDPEAVLELARSE